MQDQPINIYSWIALVLFLLVIILVVYPTRVLIPCSQYLPTISWLRQSRKRIYIPLNMATAPLIAILILLASKSISFRVVIDGFLGSEGVHPYSIMILFFALVSPSFTIKITLIMS